MLVLSIFKYQVHHACLSVCKPELFAMSTDALNMVAESCLVAALLGPASFMHHKIEFAYFPS